MIQIDKRMFLNIMGLEMDVCVSDVMNAALVAALLAVLVQILGKLMKSSGQHINVSPS